MLYSNNMLQYLNILLKHGNYTKAAKDLYISQPYLTQTIKKAEKELGVEIINRQTTPLQLTEAGRVYYQYLNGLETKQDQFLKKIAKYADKEQTTIRIGILSSLGTYILPLFLPDFQKNHPHVTVELHEAIPEYNEQKILNGDLDFFIGQNPEAISPKLTVYARGKHGYSAVIPPSSKLFQAGTHQLAANSLAIKELLQEKLILTTRGSAIRRQVDYLIQKFNSQPEIILESSNIFTIVKLAQRGLGVTFVPESVDIPDTDAPFNLYPLPLELLSLDYFIAHPAAKTLITAEKDFIKIFLEQLQIDRQAK